MVSNLADVIAESASRRPAHIALVQGERKITYAGLDDDVTAVAAGLQARGIRPGDRVAVMLGNRTSFVTALFGIVRAGAVAVPLNTASAPAEVEHYVGSAGAAVIVCDSVTTESVGQAQLGTCARIMAGSTEWEALKTAGRSHQVPPQTDPETLAVLLFTAGSTGKPKPAMLTHRSLLANIDGMRALQEPPAITPDDVALAVLPLFHVYGLNVVLTLGLAAGATIVLCDRFTPGGALDLIVKHKVTVVAGAPPMYVSWSVEPGLRDAMASVRLLTSGAAPLPGALFDQFATMTGKPIWEGYGLTECAPVVTTTLASGTPRAGSVGAPLPNVDVRIVAGPGAPLPDASPDDDDGETGDVWVRGPSLFSGYWPDAQGGPNEEGWWATGDVGYFDRNGDLHLVNRRSDLILVSGFNVYPREVENVINTHQAVAECAVTGVPHPHSGEAVKAFVALKPGAELDAEELVRYCEQRLARYKCPTIVEIVPELPHAVTGKLARGQLRPT